jgi:hypothetical protein
MAALILKIRYEMEVSRQFYSMAALLSEKDAGWY